MRAIHTMDAVLEAFALILLLSLLLGLLRIWRGPGFADRMLAAQLLGTTGVAMLLLLAGPLGRPALRDVALVLALLAVLAVLAFVARVWDPDDLPDTAARDEARAASKGSACPDDDHRPEARAPVAPVTTGEPRE